MRVFGKRGAQQRTSSEGRSWWGGFRKDETNERLDIKQSRELDGLGEMLADDLGVGVRPGTSGALALIEQLSQEINAPKTVEEAPQKVVPQEAPRRDGGFSALFDGFRAEPRASRGVETTPRFGAAAAPRAAESDVYDLLAELRNDIISLKQEQKQIARPTQDYEVRSLLAELKSDIRLLKEEQKADVKRVESREVHNLLSMLQGDIVALKQETRSFGVRPNENDAVRNMLAALKGDIAGLKGEVRGQVVSAPASTSEPFEQPEQPEADVRQLLATLKQDIASARHTYSAPVANPEESDVGKLLVTLKGDIDALKAEQHVNLNSWVRGTMKRVNRSAEKEMLHLSDVAIADGDLSGARRMYNNAINEGSIIAILELARSFDPIECNQFGAGQDVTPDPERALALYRQAASRVGQLISELGGSRITKADGSAVASRPKAKRGKRQPKKSTGQGSGQREERGTLPKEDI